MRQRRCEIARPGIFRISRRKKMNAQCQSPVGRWAFYTVICTALCGTLTQGNASWLAAVRSWFGLADGIVAQIEGKSRVGRGDRAVIPESSGWRSAEYEKCGPRLSCVFAAGSLSGRASEALREMGRVDVRGFSRRDRASAGNMSAALRHLGKTWASLAAGHGPTGCALCCVARGGTELHRGVPGILFRPDFRSETRSRNDGLQHRAAIKIVAGNHRRNGAERLQENHHRKWARRKRKPAALFRAEPVG